MTSQFKRNRHGDVTMTLDEVDMRIIAHILGEMLELLGPEESIEEDPLAAAVGIGTATKPPEDTALARLFPDGYTDDPEASADFRRYTEPGSLGEPAAKRKLTADESEAWLRALNDTRLVLGERIGVTEDWDEVVEGLTENDPRLPLFFVYDRLTYLQETLVQSLW
jgi:hypothetical protein